MESDEDLARLTITCQLRPGQPLHMVKLLAYSWSSRRSAAPCGTRWTPRSPSRGSPVGTRLAAQQREYLDRFWERSDVEVEGDPALQQAVRVSMFHVLQAGARTESQAIPAKGLTGPGYDGHAFWDTETFVLPMLTYTAPEAAKGALTWRHDTLSAAMARAAELGLDGAAFPGGPSTARSARGTGRQAPPGSTSTPTSPTRPPATSRRRRRGVRCDPRGRAAGADRAAVGLPGALLRATPASASTGSPGRTSTPPWSTTTSTRT